jgi:hypothetical protein
VIRGRLLFAGFPQLAGTVTTGAADLMPTSEIENSSMTLENMDLERMSLSAIQNQRPL